MKVDALSPAVDPVAEHLGKRLLPVDVDRDITNEAENVSQGSLVLKMSVIIKDALLWLTAIFLGFWTVGPALDPAISAFGSLIFLYGLVSLVVTIIVYKTSEFGITDRRVIIKTGFIRRTTLEIMNTRIESLGVDQSIFGRVLNFGTLVVKGTGGSASSFPAISYPMAFRKQFHQTMDTGAQGRPQSSAS